MRQRGQMRELAEDAELAGLATTGDLDAFEELYRRHVESAWRMALAVTANPHDAADAVSDAFTRVLQALPRRPEAAGHFVAYLLAAVRNAAIDGLRRGGRQAVTNPGDHRDRAAAGAEPDDAVVAGVEASLVATAFRTLPERWRSVLWLTEVENIPAREVAHLLGMSPNGVAQLAVRARAGLRQGYLQAHLRQTEVRSGCRDTVSRLGAYAAGALASRHLSKVDQHLAGCKACVSRLSQLDEVSPCLRRSALPLPAALAAISAARWHLASGGAAVGGGAATAAPTGVGIGVVVAAAPAPFVAALASAALLVAGFVGAGAMQHERHTPATAQATVAPAPPPTDVTFSTASGPPAASATPATSKPPAEVGAPAGEQLAAVAALVDDLGRDLARLTADAPKTLAAIAKGDVRVNMGPAGAAVDLRDDVQACPSVRVLSMQVGCHGITAPGVVPPVAGGPEPTTDAGAAGTDRATTHDTAAAGNNDAPGADGNGH